MRGVPLMILAILILSLPIQGALAHEGNEHEKGEAADFELNASPQKLTIHRGESISAIISLEVEETLSGRVQLTLTWDNRVPSNVSYSFSPTSLGADESSILTFTTQRDSTIGNFHFHVHGTLATETESVRMALKIKQFHPHPDFTISAEPLNLTATAGESATSTVTVTSIQGFDSPVHLSLNWETVPTNVTINLQPSTLMPTSASQLTLSTGQDTAAGVYGFHIFGISGDPVHESPQMFLILSHGGHPPPPPAKDFALNINPTSWTINPGETIDYNVTIAPVNGFNQAVSLSVTPSALTGATITLTQTTVTPPALLQLKIATTSSLKNDTYGFTVTATNGSLTHQASVYMIVLPVSTLPPTAIILTLNLSKNNITLGDMITISGRMTPPQGLGGTLLEIIYANVTNIQSNKDWSTLSWVRTNTTASYAYDWTPTQTGYYALRAIWGGNATHTAFSNIAILRVNSGSVIVQPSPEFPWFWLAIAAIIIIGVATAVTLKIRKKPVPTPTPASA